MEFFATNLPRILYLLRKKNWKGEKLGKNLSWVSVRCGMSWLALATNGHWIA